MASSKPKRAKTKPAPPAVVAKKPTKSAAKGAKKPVAKKAVAKKAPASKKPVAKKVIARTAPAPKKAVAKKAVAKKAVAKKAVAKKAVAKKAPASKKPVAKKVVAQPAPAPKKPVAKKAEAKKPAPPVKSAASVPPPTAARDALSALAQKRAIKATLEPTTDGKEVVDAYMRDVDHPFKAELEAVRQIILGASPKISERIKWNAPSFYYKEDLGAFNPRATEYAHLILLFPGGAGMEDDTLLEGKHKDRREVKFHGMDEVTAKKPALEKLVKRWVALRDR